MKLKLLKEKKENKEILRRKGSICPMSNSLERSSLSLSLSLSAHARRSREEACQGQGSSTSGTRLSPLPSERESLQLQEVHMRAGCRLHSCGLDICYNLSVPKSRSSARLAIRHELIRRRSEWLRDDRSGCRCPTLDERRLYYDFFVQIMYFYVMYTLHTVHFLYFWK